MMAAAVVASGVRRRGVVAEGCVSSRGQVFLMQRARLTGAAVMVVDDLGWSGVTVADIASRARVSRRTFYDLFADREECLLAMLQDTVGRLERDLMAVDEGAWLERVRRGLWTILSFLDRDPVLARVCVVQSARGTQRVLEAREELLSRLARVLEEGSSQQKHGAHAPVLTAEGLVGAAVAIVYKRLLTRERAPLTDLYPELMGMIILPYLGPAAAAKERKRRAPVSREQDTPQAPIGASAHERDPLREVPMRLTYRTARVLQTAALHPGESNRVIGEGAGITDQGQISRLLMRLERLGLLTNTGQGQARGESNAWQLTPLGERIAEQLTPDTQQPDSTQ